MGTDFLIVGDIHWRAVNPRARTDDFRAALTAKLLEVFGLARHHRCAAIIQTGDLTDTAGLQLSTIGDLMEILRQAPCPILAVPGNHDTWGANPDTLPRTPFGLLARGGWLQDVSRQPLHLISAGGMPIAITGHAYDAETDLEPGQYAAPAAEPGTFRIHITHGMLLHRTPGIQIRHTTLDQIAGLSELPEVLVNGHEHLTHWVQRIRDSLQDTLVLKPGALCRLTAHIEEIHRPVQVMLLTVTETGETQVQDITLTTARPGEEILSRDHLTEVAEREDRLAEFLTLLQDQGEMKFLNSLEMAERLAGEMQLPSGVLTEARSRLTRAREELGVAN